MFVLSHVNFRKSVLNHVNFKSVFFKKAYGTVILTNNILPLKNQKGISFFLEYPVL